MERNRRRMFATLAVALAAAAGFLLRRRQLGLLAAGEAGSVSVLLGVVCAVAVIGIAVTSRGLEKRSGYMESFSSGAPEAAVSAAAAVLLAMSGALTVMAQPQGLNLVMGFLGVLAGLCVAVTAAQRYRGVVPTLAFHVVPCLYLVIRLILEFRQWSIDPAVLDYCYKLFAAISLMCGTYHLGGFCMDKGQRRWSVFWCLSCVVFCGVSLADGGTAAQLLYGGGLLWGGVNAWELMED